MPTKPDQVREKKEIRDRRTNLPSLERNGRATDGSETKQSLQSNGNDSNSSNRQQDAGLIRYVYDGIELTIAFQPSSLSNTSALYCGDKVRI